MNAAMKNLPPLTVTSRKRRWRAKPDLDNPFRAESQIRDAQDRHERGREPSKHLLQHISADRQVRGGARGRSPRGTRRARGERAARLLAHRARKGGGAGAWGVARFTGGPPPFPYDRKHWGGRPPNRTLAASFLTRPPPPTHTPPSPHHSPTTTHTPPTRLTGNLLPHPFAPRLPPRPPPLVPRPFPPGPPTFSPHTAYATWRRRLQRRS